MKKKRISIFQKTMVLCVAVMLNANAFAQGRIELKSDFRGVTQLTESSLNGFGATFSYNVIETELVETEFGNFSRLVVSDAVASGEVGAPSLPVTKKMIAVPFGAMPSVKVVGYTTSDYKLDDYGVEKVYPKQPSYSKDIKIKDVEFKYNKDAYKAKSFANAPEVEVKLLGSMRGVQIASLQVEPIDYNPANNTLRVYNDISVEVEFDNVDVDIAEKMMLDTYSPYFDVVYSQLYNSKTLAGVFDEYSDLYKTPVYMTVVANSMFKEALQPWLEWKTQKGFYIDVKYVESNTSSSVIKSYIKERYDEVKPSFLVIVGDKDKVVPSLEKGQQTKKVTDLYYASVDGDYIPDVYYSRMSCETVAELENLIEKVLQYEQYTMPDPSYLNDALFIAGVDDFGYKENYCIPAVNYATQYFFNKSNGMENVHKYIDAYDGCYDNINQGVGFINYTAHGVETGWTNPAFNTDDVLNLTNKDKYFWAVGNCCLTGDWGTDKGPCLAEALVRADKKGAWGYIGSCPVSYWDEDYYFAVGATTVIKSTPKKTDTEEGFYEMFWKDDIYNSLSSVHFAGNLSVTNAYYSGGYKVQGTIDLSYYWEAYHTIGDGTVMPYRTQPTQNKVSHSENFDMGLDFYTVSANPSSYVAITKDGVLLGTAKVGRQGVVDVPITPVLTDGNVIITVTHPQRVPYIKSVLALPTSGPYLSVYSYTPEKYPVNQENKMTLTMRNVGNDPVEAVAKVTLTSESEFLKFVDNEATFTSLQSGCTLDLVDEFSFVLDKSLEDMDVVVINAKIEYDTLVWNNEFAISVTDPVIEYEGVEWDGSYEPGETYILHAKFKNVGHYDASNVVVNASSSNEYITFKNTTSEIETIAVDSIATFDFEVTINDACSIEERIAVEFALTADNDIASDGSYVLKNLCSLVFTLKDSFGDGWGKSAIEIKYSDDTPADTLSILNGKELVEQIDVVVGTTVTVSFIKEKYGSYECSYVIEYKDGEKIYDSGKNIKEGVNVEFVVSCFSSESLNELANIDLTIYPNPAKDVINIESSAQNLEYQLINGMGQIVLKGDLSGEKSIRVENVNNGVYFLKFIADGKVLVNKVIIQ